MENNRIEGHVDGNVDIRMANYLNILARDDLRSMIGIDDTMVILIENALNAYVRTTTKAFLQEATQRQQVDSVMGVFDNTEKTNGL